MNQRALFGKPNTRSIVNWCSVLFNTTGTRKTMKATDNRSLTAEWNGPTPNRKKSASVVWVSQRRCTIWSAVDLAWYAKVLLLLWIFLWLADVTCLAKFAPIRQDEYCSGTSAVLASALQSNTDVQCPYRLPLCSATHDPDCKQKGCVKEDATEIKS